MANLIEYIQSQVYENSTEDISGSIMQQVLTRMASDEGVVNVHTISGQTPFADYNNAQAARDAVPADFKKLGLIITYKLSSGWYIDEFIGSATSGWSTASNWKCLGPISVSQNASTGKTTITIGSQSYDVATQPVSVSQNIETGKTELLIGDTPALIVDNVPEVESDNLVKSGGVFDFSSIHLNLTEGWKNKNYVGANDNARLSIFIPKESLSYLSVKAPTGYKIGISADELYVWTGTGWSTANLYYDQQFDLSKIDFGSYNVIGFTLRADDDSNISPLVGNNVIFSINVTTAFKNFSGVINGTTESGLLKVNSKQIFGDYAESFIEDLNDAPINTAILVQNYIGNIANFPSDFPNPSSQGILYSYKAKFGTADNQLQIIQVLQLFGTLQTWRRSFSYLTNTWSNWVGVKPFIPDVPILSVNDKQLFGDYAQEVLTDLNNASDNRIYIVQRTSLTTTANFPSDYTSGFALLYCFKAYYSESGIQQIQILNKIGDDIVWKRSRNNYTTWGDWQIMSTTNVDIPKAYYVGVGQQYATLKSAIAEAVQHKNSTVIVMPGTYDLVTEFSGEITSSMGVTGIGLGNGIHIIFRDGAKVKALFDNSESTYDTTTWRRIYDYFNPFYSLGINGNADFILENADIECSNTRYCVHDEMAGEGVYMHKYINCKMKYTNNHEDINYVQCIGGGLGEHATIVVDGGIYQSVPNYGYSLVGGAAANSQQCISYHNGYGATCESSITIKDVYFKDRGYFRFGYYGSSTIKSLIEICNCSTGLPTLKKAEGTSVIDNFDITEWNENVRIPSHWVVSADGTTAELVEDN